MKILFQPMLFLLCFLSLPARGVNLLSEGFDTNGDGSRYQGNFGQQATGGDIFNRVTTDLSLNPANFSGGGPSNQNGPVIAGSDIEKQPNAFASPNEDVGIIRFAPINITDMTTITGTISIGVAQGDEDRFYGVSTPRFIRVQYAVDGNIGPFTGTDADLLAGNYTTVLNLVPSSSGTGMYVNGNTGNQKLLSNFNPVFSFSIPATGNSLSIQVSMNAESSGDEWAFDNVTVDAIPASTPPPALANIEGGNLSYTEGDPATQITSSLTVTDPNSSSLTSGTVSISSGFSTGDLLEFTNQNGISGVFSGNTLTLSGTSSVANYQTALRSVTYRNSNAINPSLTTRTIRFQVTDEDSNNSGIAARNITLVPTLSAGTIPFTESFESINESITYLSNSYNTGADHFFRHNFGTTNPHPQHPVAVAGVDGSFAWAAEDIASASNPLGSAAPGIIRFQDLDTIGFTDLQVQLALANTILTGTFEVTDIFEIQAAFDGNRATGNDIQGGSYTTIGRFIGNGNQLQQDTDLNGSPDGTLLSATLQDFSFSIPGSGSLLSVRVVDTQDGGSEEHVFDHLRVTGTVVSQDPPALATIESSALSYTEGDPATAVTATITVGDADDTDLEQATISFDPATFVVGEDQLLFTNQNGISGTFAGDVLTLTGTSSLANYEIALRSIQYQNTNSTNPDTRVRTIRFVVNDGEVDSNQLQRDIVIVPLLGPPISLPFCESFETDGEGVRYVSNTFSVPANGIWFRTDQNPVETGWDTLIGPDGTFFWAGEQTTNVGNPLNPDENGYVKTAGITITGFVNLQADVLIAQSRAGSGSWEDTDFIEIQAAFDGDSGDAFPDTGNWTVIGRFIGIGGLGADLQQDTNLDGSPDGTVLTTTFQNFSFPISGIGDLLSIRVVQHASGTEEAAFDTICVTGTAVNDWGDAPDPFYPTVSTNNGARHTPTGPTLGALRDGEIDGQPNGTASGDDLAGSDDEDGVTFGTLAVGQSGSITVNVQVASASLDAWIDINQDGSWFDAGEQIATNLAVSVGDNIVPISVSCAAATGTTYARFRLSTAGGLSVTNLATDGEVEDYEVTIVPDVVPPVAQCKNFTAVLITDGVGGGTVTVLPNDIDDGSSDNCGIASMVVSPNTFTCTNLGQNVPVTLTVMDTTGNTNSCVATVTVADTNAVCNVPPEAQNGAGADVIAKGATLNANLSAGNIANLTIYWGDNDGGTDPGLWDDSIDLGSVTNGFYSAAVSNLLFGVEYYYRSFASNSVSNDWADNTVAFQPLDPNIGELKITLCGYVQNNTLTNLPVMVKLGQEPGFTYDGFISPAGDDLRFWNSNQTVVLNYEIELWDTGGVSYVWVDVPEVVPSNSVIWATWSDESDADKPAYTTNGSTWSNNYVGVWHLGDDTGTGLFPDSVSDNDASDNGASDTATTTGQIANAQFFDGGVDELIVANESNFDFENSITVSAWFRVEAFTTGWQGLVTKGDSSWRLHRDTTVNNLNWVAGSAITAPVNINDGQWHHVVADKTTTNGQRIYIDGMLAASNGNLTPIGANDFQVYIGENSQINGREWFGDIDEVRIGGSIQSAEWISASYLNAASNDLFNCSDLVSDGFGGIRLANDPATGITETSAIANATFEDIRSVADVRLYWNTVDGGTNASLWTNSAFIGSFTNVSATSLGQGLTNLQPNTTYFYTWNASNIATIVWADPSESLTTLGPTDLSIMKTVDIPSLIIGTNLSYSIIASNAGPNTASNVVVIDTLPATVTLINSVPAPDSSTNGVLTYAVGDLIVGATALIQIDVSVDTNATTTLTNAVQVAASFPSDTNLVDNTDTAETVLPDFDSDGMKDFVDPDDDDDGVSDIEEEIADTDRADPFSLLRFNSIVLTGETNEVTWQGGVLATQYLEQSVIAVTGVQWKTVFTNLPPTPITNTQPDSPSVLTNSTLHYRIRVE